MGHVQLEEAAALGPIGGPDGFDGGRACGREAIGELELAGHLGHGKFAGRVVDFVDPDWGEADGRRDLVPEDCASGVTRVGVDKLAGDDAVAVECLAVSEVSVGEPGVGGGVEPAVFGEFGFCEFFELAGVCVWWGKA